MIFYGNRRHHSVSPSPLSPPSKGSFGRSGLTLGSSRPVWCVASASHFVVLKPLLPLVRFKWKMEYSIHNLPACLPACLVCCFLSRIRRFVHRPTTTTTVHRIISQTLGYTCHAHSEDPLWETGKIVRVQQIARGVSLCTPPFERTTEVKHKCHAIRVV